MRLVHLTPGTGNFHCGSCHRDNSLVKALRQLGHEVTMVPLYLPLVTDGEPSSGNAPLFAGGINMWLQQKLALFRHTPRWLDKWLDSSKLLQFAASKASMTSARDLGEMTVESLLGTDGRQYKEWRRLIDWMAHEEKPDAVSVSNGLLSGLAKVIRQELKIPVYVSLQGEDSFLDTLPEPFRSRSWRLMEENAAYVSKFIATSEWYAETMRERLRLSPEQLAAVPNGLDLAAYQPAQPPAVPTIGFLARLIAGKGLDQLVDGFLDLAARDSVPGVRLAIGGTMTDADLPFIEQQKAKLAAAGLSDRVDWRPNLTAEAKIAHLQGLSILSVPATYGEAFGLYVLEALACGVPVVEPNHAGLAELVTATGGGLLCAPNDKKSLVDAWERLLSDTALRQNLATHGRQQVLANYSHQAMAERFLRAISF
jgi:glycosyltransferase involved in cell wall biosynthesis